MHAALEAIAEATGGTSFDGDLWVVGGAVRDELLGLEAKNDFDIVTRGSSLELAQFLFHAGVSSMAPVEYREFGVAMIEVQGSRIEIMTARKESYRSDSRKPDVLAATLEEDALRRDFTVNALLKNLHTDALYDPLGRGLEDLRARVLRTPREPAATFHDDPLRMLRAVRFRHQLGFQPAPGLFEAVAAEAERLGIVSAERIRDELLKMLQLDPPSGPLRDLMELGLMRMIVPELLETVGVEQGRYHHLDVWHHTLLVVDNAGTSDPLLSLAALFHDIGKPRTRTFDAEGNTRFFGHEAVGAEMTREILRRLRLPQKDVDTVVSLVKNHMRLGSTPEFTPAAARRLIRDLGSDVDRLLRLVEADANGLKRGLKVLDLRPIRERLEEVRRATPQETLGSPLSGAEIMQALGIAAGPEVGRIKALLMEQVLEGELAPGDREGALRLLGNLSSGI